MSHRAEVPSAQPAPAVSAAATSPEAELTQFMECSEQRVLSLRLLSSLQRMIHPILPRRVSFALAAGSWGLAPLFLNLALSLWGHACTGTSLAWLAYYAVLNICLMVFPTLQWRRLVHDSEDVDALFMSDSDRQITIARFETWLRWPYQLGLSVTASIAGVLALHYAASPIAHEVTMCPASYISITISSVLGANAIYFIWAVPHLVRYLAQLERLRLRWWSPATTPAIDRLSLLLAESAGLAAIGVSLFLIPIVYVVSVTTGRWSVALLTASLIGSVGTVVFIAIVPQWWLGAIVQRTKEQVLETLSNDIDQDPALLTGAAGASPEDATRNERAVNMYAVVVSSPTLPNQLKSVVAGVFSVFAVMLPYIIELVRSGL